MKRAVAEVRYDWRAKGWLRVQVLNFRGHIEVAFRTKEETVPHPSSRAAKAKVTEEFRVRRAGREAKISRPTLRVETHAHRHRFEQS